LNQPRLYRSPPTSTTPGGGDPAAVTRTLRPSVSFRHLALRHPPRPAPLDELFASCQAPLLLALGHRPDPWINAVGRRGPTSSRHAPAATTAAWCWSAGHLPHDVVPDQVNAALPLGWSGSQAASWLWRDSEITGRCRCHPTRHALSPLAYEASTSAATMASGRCPSGAGGLLSGWPPLPPGHELLTCDQARFGRAGPSSVRGAGNPVLFPICGATYRGDRLPLTPGRFCSSSPKPPLPADLPPGSSPRLQPRRWQGRWVEAAASLTRRDPGRFHQFRFHLPKAYRLEAAGPWPNQGAIENCRRGDRRADALQLRPFHPYFNVSAFAGPAGWHSRGGLA